MKSFLIFIATVFAIGWIASIFLGIVTSASKGFSYGPNTNALKAEQIRESQKETVDRIREEQRRTMENYRQKMRDSRRY